MLRMTKRNGHLNDLGDGFAGGNGYGNLGAAAVKLKDNLAGNGGFGHGRNGYRGIPDVSFIEETGLLERNLNGDCHHHFAFGNGVTHGRVVSIHAHIIGGEFVGGAEAEGELAVIVGEKMRLEREGLEEFASDCYILRDSSTGIKGIGRNRHLFFGHLHCHGGGSGIQKDGVLAHAGHCLGAVAHYHNVVVDIITHAAAGRNNIHVRHGVVGLAHHGPVIARHGVHALVPGGGKGLNTGVGLERKCIFSAGICLVLETRKLQWQNKFGAGTPVLALVFDRLAVNEIEQLQAHGVRPRFLEVVADFLHGAVVHLDLAGVKHLGVLAENGGLDPGGAAGRSNHGLYAGIHG